MMVSTVVKEPTRFTEMTGRIGLKVVLAMIPFTVVKTDLTNGEVLARMLPPTAEI